MAKLKVNKYKRKFKAVIVDYDGTLVDHEQSINPDLARYIVKLNNSGILFSIATGRPLFGTIRRLISQLKLNNLHIVNGGAQIYDTINGQYIFQELLSYREVHQIINFMQARKLSLMVEGEKYFYTNNMEANVVYKHDFEIKPLDKMPRQSYPKLILPSRTSKMTEEGIDTLIKNFSKIFKDLHISKIHVPLKADNGRVKNLYGLDISSIRGTKQTAVHAYMKHYSLQREEVICAGDNYNDYPLFLSAGVRVAMGNAVEELKAIADFVAPSVSENGLMTALKYYIRPPL